jgi:hypothetical protein
MTRSSFLLLLGLLVACGEEDPKSRCAADCSGEAPYCDGARGVCVACRDDDDCDGTEVCVPTTTSAVCGECRTELDCGGGHCAEGSCIECTVATEAADCGLFSCDPQLGECTETERGTLQRLAPCRADSECMGMNSACVPTIYMGQPDGTHCLRKTLEGVACPRPTTTVTSARESISWMPAQTYCGFNENAVSAEAVRSMIEGKTCASTEDDATCGKGGLCRYLAGAGGYRCTIPCGSDESCPTDGPAANCYSDIESHCGTPA